MALVIEKSRPPRDVGAGIGVGVGVGGDEGRNSLDNGDTADSDLLRKRIGLSPRLMAEAVERCGTAGAVEEAYGRWREEILRAAGGPDGGREMSTKDLAELLGVTTDYIAQLKIRRMVTWSGRREGPGSGDRAVGRAGAFVFTRRDVEALFELSEHWLRGGSEVVGGSGIKGPLGHLFVASLRGAGHGA